MPVAPVASATTSAPPDAPAQPVVGGFDEVLARKLPAADSLPSVPLQQMVASLADGSTSPAGFGPLERAAADPWGIAPDPAAADGGPRDVGGVGAAVLRAGERYLGVPYRWGGTDASTGFDCSGFVQQVYADLGVRLPRVSVDQARAGSAVANLDAAEPGDLVFWRATGGRPNHIGIYAGDGQMLVAPRTGDVVRYQQISRTPDAIRRVTA